MAGFVFHPAASAMCPHGGQLTTIPSSPRVRVAGQPAATLGDTFTIAGCAFTIPPAKPQPCVTVRWLTPATRVRAAGQPIVLSTSGGLCQSPEQIPQGPLTVNATQVRVRAT